MVLFVHRFMRFVPKVAVLSAVLWYLVTRIFNESLPSWIVKNSLPLAVLLSTVVLGVDAMFIYPFFRSPLRHIPAFGQHGREVATLVLESPRGKTPLKWMKENPTADVIHIHGGFNVSMLIPVSPLALKDLLNTNAYDFVKPRDVSGFLARVIGYGLILSEGDAHRKQRKALTPAFNIRKIRELYDLIWEKTGILLGELEKEINMPPSSTNYGEEKSTNTIEIAEWGSRLTLDVIGPTAMGKDFRSLTTKENPIAEAFLEILQPTPERLSFFGLHFVFPHWILAKLPSRVNEVLNRNGGFLRDTCYKIIQEKKFEMLKKNIAQYDILSGIIQTNEFTDSEIVDQMLTFLAAGHETTASALTWCCYLMCCNPNIQSKLRAEIRAAIPTSTSPITWDLLESMPYLNGVCEETLRLFPTVPTSIREAIRDTTVAGLKIPKETLFILVPYATNRLPAFWGSNADEMVPERWIDTMPDGSQRPNKNGGAMSNFNEITFLHGPRACIGRDFAKAELRCAVAGVVGKFAMELARPDEEIKISGVITTKPANGMHLKMKVVEGW